MPWSRCGSMRRLRAMVTAKHARKVLTRCLKSATTVALTTTPGTFSP